MEIAVISALAYCIIGVLYGGFRIVRGDPDFRAALHDFREAVHKEQARKPGYDDFIGVLFTAGTIGIFAAIGPLILIGETWKRLQKRKD